MPTCWFDQTLAVADYAPPFDRAVTALKFGRQLPLARPLGELLAARWRGHTPTLELDCLIPVPLSAPRLAQRGFNQALELARGMSTALPRNLPIERRALRRIRDTPAQTSLSMRARHVNLHEALVCPQRLDGARVGLVDDVMTSGTTLNEAARALKHAGASWVLGLVLARTAPPSTESHAAAAVQPSEAKPGRDPTATDQALEHLAPTKTRQRRPP
jgi:ComF family protein